LKAHDPHGYLDKDQDLQKAIADKLMALADSGVTDPQELRRRSKTSISSRRINGRYAYPIQPSSRALSFAACQARARVRKEACGRRRRTLLEDASDARRGANIQHKLLAIANH